MNSVVRQLWEQNTDIVMVDTGNSYEGLCEYVGGKYIAYTEDKPITMNPFNISKRELNIEKIDFLKNLILLIWKGSETQIPELEFRVVEQLVTEYYDFYFNGVQPYPSSQKETVAFHPMDHSTFLHNLYLSGQLLRHFLPDRHHTLVQAILLRFE